MTPLLEKMLRASVRLEAALKRVATILGRILLSKTEVMRRSSGRFEALKRKEQEAERLDRLRNPRDYAGK